METIDSTRLEPPPPQAARKVEWRRLFSKWHYHLPSALIFVQNSVIVMCRHDFCIIIKVLSGHCEKNSGTFSSKNKKIWSDTVPDTASGNSIKSRLKSSLPTTLFASSTAWQPCHCRWISEAPTIHPPPTPAHTSTHWHEELLPISQRMSKTLCNT